MSLAVCIGSEGQDNGWQGVGNRTHTPGLLVLLPNPFIRVPTDLTKYFSMTISRFSMAVSLLDFVFGTFAENSEIEQTFYINILFLSGCKQCANLVQSKGKMGKIPCLITKSHFSVPIPPAKSQYNYFF